MKEVMKMDKNPETGQYLCWIPNTGYAWYVIGEKNARKFCKKFNQKFESNQIRLNDRTGIIERIK